MFSVTEWVVFEGSSLIKDDQRKSYATGNSDDSVHSSVRTVHGEDSRFRCAVHRGDRCSFLTEKARCLPAVETRRRWHGVCDNDLKRLMCIAIYRGLLYRVGTVTE